MKAMALQNRVTPLGELVADPARGLVYGNRGCLHDETGRIRRRYDGKRWIACRLEFRGRRRDAADAARALHGALLPRRGDGVRGRPPAVRAMPARGLRPLRGALARAPARRRRAPTRWTSSCTRERARRPAPAPPRGAVRRAARRGVRARDGAPWLVLGRELLRGRPPATRARAAAAAATRGVITPPSLVACCAPAGSRLVPLLHPSA